MEVERGGVRLGRAHDAECGGEVRAGAYGGVLYTA
jgi:hypothetical protein